MSQAFSGKVAMALIGAGVVLFFLGTVGQGDGGLWPDGPGRLGAVGCSGFLLCRSSWSWWG